MTALGIFVGNSGPALLEWESWMGREADFVRVHGGKKNWSDHASSLGWVASQFQSTGRPYLWSVPLIVKDATLAAAAAGSYDSNYRTAAQNVLANSPNSGPIYVRTGEEFNGGWFEWTISGGKEASFIGAFRKFVTAFRSISDRFVFEWNCNIGQINPAPAYPGDAFVDIIGMDFYWNKQWDPHDPAAAFSYMVNRQFGLQWLEDFAASRNKPTGYSEWGIDDDNAAAYVNAARDWFASHNVVYQCYWQSDSAYSGKLTPGTPSADAFKAAFATSAPAPAPVLTAFLMDASTDMQIMDLTPGVVIPVGFVADGNATIIAHASSPVGSVRLSVGPYGRVESVAPYALFGDVGNDLNGGLFLDEGPHTLTLTAYSGSGGSGSVLGSVDIGFEVRAEVVPDPDLQARIDELESEVARLTTANAMLWDDLTAANDKIAAALVALG